MQQPNSKYIIKEIQKNRKESAAILKERDEYLKKLVENVESTQEDHLFHYLIDSSSADGLTVTLQQTLQRRQELEQRLFDMQSDSKRRRLISSNEPSEDELKEFKTTPFGHVPEINWSTHGNILPKFIDNAGSTTAAAAEHHGESSVGESSKPKTSSRKTPDNRVRKYKPIEQNADGTYAIPARYGGMQLINIGTIDTDPAYHTERYIYPVNYHVKRPYLSTIDLTEDVQYECRILKVDESGPTFEVKSLQTGKIYTGRSSSGAWIGVVHEAFILRNRAVNSSICGPDLFGLSSPEVAKMIQDLPNADKLKKYKWQEFIQK